MNPVTFASLAVERPYLQPLSCFYRDYTQREIGRAPLFLRHRVVTPCSWVIHRPLGFNETAECVQSPSSSHASDLIFIGISNFPRAAASSDNHFFFFLTACEKRVSNLSYYYYYSPIKELYRYYSALKIG